MKKSFVLFSIIVFIAAVPLRVNASPEAAQQAVEQYLNLMQKVDFSAPENEITRQTDLANAYLDFESLSKNSLPSDWEKISPTDREDFLKLIKPLVAYVAYPKGKRLLRANKVDYTDSQLSAAGVTVSTVIREQEKALDVTVVYHLYESSGKWLIDDVILDDVSISEDLRYQFEKIIKDSGFSGLLQKMQERLVKAKQEAPEKESPGSAS